MPRLPTTGASLMTPCREESELKCVLSELCPGTIFNDDAVHQLYTTLASLIGGWLSEQARLETSPVKNALLTTAKNLSEASTLLSGLETGFHSDMEMTVARRVPEPFGAESGDRFPGVCASYARFISTKRRQYLSHLYDCGSGPPELSRKARSKSERLVQFLYDASPEHCREGWY